MPLPTRHHATGLVRSSFQQESLLRKELVPPSNLLDATLVRGPLDTAALIDSLNAVTQRHAALRTIFHQRGRDFYQEVVHETRPPCSLEQVDSNTPLPPLLAAVVDEESRYQFDHLRELPIRFRIIALAEDLHFVLVNVSHVASDMWSMGVILKDLWAAYRAISAGSAPGFAELPFDYSDYAITEREFYTDQVLEQRVAYWQDGLLNSSPLIFFPSDLKPPHALHDDRYLYEGQRRSFLSGRLGSEVASRLRSTAISASVFFAVLVAAMQHYYSGTTDVLVRVVVHNRRWPQLAEIVGPLFQATYLRLHLDDDPTLDQLAQQASIGLAKGLLHDTPGMILRQFRGAAGVPLNLLGQAPRHGPVEVPGVVFDRASLPPPRRLVEEIPAFFAGDRRGEVVAQFAYDASAFSDERVRLIVAHADSIAQRLVTSPSARLSELGRVDDAAGFDPLKVRFYVDGRSGRR